MEEFLLTLINFNESQINYPLIFTVFVLYLLFLWVAVCIWVMSDARKRYSNVSVQVIIFFFVLIFNLPALIFYLLIRPDFTHEEEELLEATIYNTRKLDPILFSGDQGFDINLNIRILPKTQGDGNHHELDVDLAWVPTGPTVKPEELKEYEQLESRMNDEPIIAEKQNEQAHGVEQVPAIKNQEDQVENEATPTALDAALSKNELPMQDKIHSLSDGLRENWLKLSSAFIGLFQRAKSKISAKKVQESFGAEVSIDEETTSFENIGNSGKKEKKNKKKKKRKFRR